MNPSNDACGLWNLRDLQAADTPEGKAFTIGQNYPGHLWSIYREVYVLAMSSKPRRVLGGHGAFSPANEEDGVRARTLRLPAMTCCR